MRHQPPSQYRHARQVRAHVRASLLFLSLLLVAGCGGPAATTDAALRYARALHTAIEEFEISRTRTAGQMGELRETIDTVIHTTQELHHEEALPPAGAEHTPTAMPPVWVELTGMAKTWEVEWGSVRREYALLQQHFADTGARADAYFRQLDLITQEIHDEGVRAAQQRENDSLKRTWTLAYTQAEAQIAQLEVLIRIGDDIERVLRLSALRASLNEDLRELETISIHAQSLLEQLEQLTHEGRRLTAGS